VSLPLYTVSDAKFKSQKCTIVKFYGARPRPGEVTMPLRPRSRRGNGSLDAATSPSTPPPLLALRVSHSSYPNCIPWRRLWGVCLKSEIHEIQSLARNPLPNQRNPPPTTKSTFEQPETKKWNPWNPVTYWQKIHCLKSEIHHIGLRRLPRKQPVAYFAA